MCIFAKHGDVNNSNLVMTKVFTFTSGHWYIDLLLIYTFLLPRSTLLYIISPLCFYVTLTMLYLALKYQILHLPFWYNICIIHAPSIPIFNICMHIHWKSWKFPWTCQFQFTVCKSWFTFFANYNLLVGVL